MSNTYTWTIIQLPCYSEHQGKEAVVFDIIWKYSGTDGNGHFGEAYGSTPITFDPTSTFTPFDQLQENDVIRWIESALGVDGIQNIRNNVDRGINLQINPAVVKPTPPWEVDKSKFEADIMARTKEAIDIMESHLKKQSMQANQ